MTTPQTHMVFWKSMVDAAAMQCTVSWPEVFGNAHPIDLEIGCGNGLWLRAYAASHTERNVIGAEIVGKFVRETNRRTVRDGQNNIRLLAGDARVIVPLGFPDCSIARVFVNFPDPWFKKRHLKRRLLNPVFLRMISRKMLAGGDIVLATDDADYCAFARESFAEVRQFEPMFSGPYLDALPDYPETKYERKWRSMGRQIYYMQYRNSTNNPMELRTYVHAQGLEYALERLGIALEPATARPDVVEGALS